MLAAAGCAQHSNDRGDHPAGYNRYDEEWDYLECEIKARAAGAQHFYNQSNPDPFCLGPQNPAVPARIPQGRSMIKAMCDTCLEAKGYPIELRRPTLSAFLWEPQQDRIP